MGTTVRPPERVGTPAGAATAPVPRRLRAPRWLDLRLVLGVLLVLGSVLLGARVVGAADAMVPVWAAQEDLAAGTVLTAEDLTVVDVRLEALAPGYRAASVRPEGRTLSRAVGAGELLPRAALAESTGLVQVALPVQAGWVPPGLQRGRLVDVYAVADPAAGAMGAPDGSVGLVVGNAPVQSVSGSRDGVLSTPTTSVQVVVSVPADDAPDVFAAVGGRPLVVVLHDDIADHAGPTVVGGPPAADAAAEEAGTD